MPKFKTGCPGQNSAYLKDFKTKIVLCHKCGCEIEFFADERKVKCPKCGSSVFRVNPEIILYKDGKISFGGIENSCLDWCGACLDKKDYEDMVQNNKRMENKRQDFKKLLDSIPEKEIDITEFFIDAFMKSINHLKLIDPKIFTILQDKNPDLFFRARNYYLNFLGN
jgi:hypothetical protein